MQIFHNMKYDLITTLTSVLMDNCPCFLEKGIANLTQIILLIRQVDLSISLLDSKFKIHISEVCGFYLSEGLDEDNCLDYLVLADKYNEKYLKESVLEFVVKNVSSLRKTDRWIDMKKDHISLLCEVMEKAMDENKI